MVYRTTITYANDNSESFYFTDWDESEAEFGFNNVLQYDSQARSYIKTVAVRVNKRHVARIQFEENCELNSYTAMRHENAAIYFQDANGETVEDEQETTEHLTGEMFRI